MLNSYGRKVLSNLSSQFCSFIFKVQWATLTVISNCAAKLMIFETTKCNISEKHGLQDE